MRVIRPCKVQLETGNKMKVKNNFRARNIIPLANTTISLCRILPV